MRSSNLQLIASNTSRQGSAIPPTLVSLGAAVGAIASLGAVVGLVVAAFAKTFLPDAEVSYGEWIGYSGALSGLFALVVELSHRAG